VTHSLTGRLLAWYRTAHRDLPWRATNDPYRIWLSEVMLQQTRAQTAIPYYERFLARFPSADALAEAAEDEVLALWSGLGYYSRARNLLRAAKEIRSRGTFPSDYESIRGLPGAGDYTAAAVASIAFGLPHAVVDGNVLRVVARVQNDASEIGAASTRERFRDIAQQWLHRKSPGDFNQALMELGATVCLPAAPACERCPIAAYCEARRAGTVSSLPVKIRKTTFVRIAETVVVLKRGSRILLKKESDSAKRMAGFWTLPAPADLPEVRLAEPVGEFRHTITRHHYRFTVYVSPFRGPVPPGMKWFETADLAKIPLSTTARKAQRVARLALD
jgi:A/G-specific adenine glycosylase